MKPPLRRAGDDRLSGQAGAVKEEDQADADRDGDVQDRAGLAPGRQQGGQDHHAKDQEDVDVGLQQREPARASARRHASTRKDSCRSDTVLRPSAISRSSRRVG